jgi:hypothetical protein
METQVWCASSVAGSIVHDPTGHALPSMSNVRPETTGGRTASPRRVRERMGRTMGSAEAPGEQSWVAHPRVPRLVKGMRDAPFALGPLRWIARRRVGALLPDSVTVVIVTWNSHQFLPTTLRALRKFADRDVRIIVVDNGSDRSPRPVTENFGARLVRLPANTGHSFALDVGCLLSRTEFVLTLDVDAFPYDSGWMPRFLEPMDRGMLAVGCSWQDWAHPCCMTLRTRDFVLRNLTFRANAAHGWDVGQELSSRLGRAAIDLVPRTGPVPPSGAMLHAHFGDVVYHNGYSSRHLRFVDPGSAELDGEITRSDALDAWVHAVADSFRTFLFSQSDS